MSDLQELRRRLVAAQKDALRIYEADKATASEASIAFDSGRYDGLKQALEIIDKLGA